jgi:hypothetical protein
MIYVASPYSSPIPELVEQRVSAVTQFVDELIIEGFIAFSPIVYCHPIARRLNKGTAASDWMAFNMGMLRISEAAYFLRLPGWERSEGMKIERNVCRLLNIPTQDFGSDFEPITEH